ncbi:hydroxyneurosporene methyltransferase [Actinomadura soli]|uniref:Hydroxyneurosporene methyltransferase n=2 Tax=Actinomadura soli TaxID=2508997 RepID=A0A5C4J5X6_9ACTN|nr:hydroxyneurosporene methyltransferase [Actinomadura soli]
MGSMVTQAVHVAARLDLPEILAAGPLPAAEIARRAQADPDATYRLLRLLAGYSIFAERPDGMFESTPMAAALRADTPMNMRDMALLLGGPEHWEDWGHLVDAVRTGEPVPPKLRGMGIYDYLAANPGFAQVFVGAMGNLSEVETQPILDAYDFTRYDTIVDVYGGGGSLLAAVLGAAPKSRGVLVDERANDMGAQAIFERAGVADRYSIDGTALFERPPAGGDAYILKHIVHEWSEAKALELLTNVRASINEDGRLLVMEFVVPEGPERHPGKLVDLWLLLLIGGRERTEAQYADLFTKAGFELTQVVGTASAVSIIEGRPV